MTQVTPKSDYSNLYFFSFAIGRQPLQNNCFQFFIQREGREHTKSPYLCKYFHAFIHPFEIQQLALWIFGSISDSQKNCAMHQQFPMHCLKMPQDYNTN